MNIIIIGHINSGKTTVANYISKKYDCVKYSLGDGVKKFIVDLFDILNKLNPNIKKIKLEELYDRNTKENYRQHMQLLSTELCRKYFGNDVWTNYLNNTINYSKSFIIDDVRFKSEYEFFKDKSISIRIIRPETEDKINITHISETELNDLITDYTIYNNGSLNDLYLMVDKIIDSIQSRIFDY